jgi:S1-C subfamily serine protease
MNAFAHAGLVTLSLLALTQVAIAQNHSKVLPYNVPVPQIGFYSDFNGEGEEIVEVLCGSIAEQIGLEEGDVILAVNGYRLDRPGAWSPAIRRAAATGYVRLAIQDVNTGDVVYRGFRTFRPTLKAPYGE